MWPSDLSAKRPQTWHKKAQHVFELFWTSGKTRLQVRRRLQTNVPNPNHSWFSNRNRATKVTLKLLLSPVTSRSCKQSHQMLGRSKHPERNIQCNGDWVLNFTCVKKCSLTEAVLSSAHLYKYSKWKETEPLAFPPLMDAITASRTTKPVLRSGLESVRIPYHPHWRHWHCPGCNSKEYSTNLRLIVSEVRDGKEHPSRFFVQGPSSKNKLQRLETLPKTANEQSNQGQFVGDPHSRVLL